MGGSFLRLAAGRSPPRAGDVTRASGGSARTDSHAKGRAPRGRAAQLLRVSRSPAASRRKERMRTKDAHGHEQHEAITNQARRAQSSGPPRPAQPASGGPPAAQRSEHAGPYPDVSRRGSSPGQTEIAVG